MAPSDEIERFCGAFIHLDLQINQNRPPGHVISSNDSETINSSISEINSNSNAQQKFDILEKDVSLMTGLLEVLRFLDRVGTRMIGSGRFDSLYLRYIMETLAGTMGTHGDPWVTHGFCGATYMVIRNFYMVP
ncbi:hypothetical protein MKZ38_010252 [Zalerion maritima]|uniref:Uncharacterized protein n=1 Tax=Zalerion maritima TaxID=339359 RepID=A0AAD5WV89_9PEZI|nr:hypothetical protein MKZ38_010252 [Zalerion maritima]